MVDVRPSSRRATAFLARCQALPSALMGDGRSDPRVRGRHSDPRYHAAMEGIQTSVAATGISPPVSTSSGTPHDGGPAVTGHRADRPPTSGVTAASWAVKASIIPWMVARVVVGVALAVAHQLAAGHHISATAAARVHEGLLGWDAGWYESIARQGYAGAGHQSLRFFPFFPLLARALSVLPGIGVGTAVVIVANISALVGTAVVVALVRSETADVRLARRVAWLVCLAPAAFTFVMGYAEGTLLAFSAGVFLALRARHWWWAAALGAAAGLTRPLGALLLVPALIEAGRGWRRAGLGQRVGRLAAVVAPVVGAGAFLGWVGWRYGDALTPLRLQEQGVHHGRLADPLVTLAHDASYLAHGRHLGEGLHLPWVLLAVFLVVVAFRSWPASYGAFAVAVLAVALTGSNLDSFERYALSAFPLVLAGATLLSRPRLYQVVLVLSAAGLAAYALLAFTNLYVP
jgi:hypothetical protein